MQTTLYLNKIAVWAVSCTLLILTATNAAAITVPHYVKESVGFIFVTALDKNGNPVLDEQGNEVHRPAGTGFFVIVGDARQAKGHIYLATAKHVLQDGNKGYFPSIFLRLNKRTGGAEEIPIQLEGPNAIPIIVHTDPHIDLAVIPIMPDPSIFEYTAVPMEMFASPEKVKQLKIMEGDEVFFTGLFHSFQGNKRNYPIVRWGRVALMTEEMVPWGGEKDKRHLYLIEAQSFGGNSGSPVFFYLTGMRNPENIRVGGFDLLLAGVMMGYFGASSGENAGIAAVTPAYQLRDVLSNPEIIRDAHNEGLLRRR